MFLPYGDGKRFDGKVVDDLVVGEIRRDGYDMYGTDRHSRKRDVGKANRDNTLANSRCPLWQKAGIPGPF